MYQALSPDGRQSEIELGHHLSQIASSLMNAYAAEGIRLDIKVDHTPTSINVALPVGLIVNKLMTNAFKYAFADQPGGTITLHCLRQEDPERYCVMVGDDGMGLPEGGRWPVPGKIGALIVQALHENTKADMVVETERNRGVRVTLRFGHKLPIAVGHRSEAVRAMPRALVLPAEGDAGAIAGVAVPGRPLIPAGRRESAATEDNALLRDLVRG